MRSFTQVRKDLKGMLAVKVEKLFLKAEEFHLAGQHDQESHGNWASEGDEGDAASTHADLKKRIAAMNEKQRTSPSGPSAPRAKEIAKLEKELKALERSNPELASPPPLSSPSADVSGRQGDTSQPYTVLTRNPDGRPKSVKYTGPRPRLLDQGDTGFTRRLTDQQLEMIRHPQSQRQEYDGMALYDPVRNQWVKPAPHSHYRIQLAGLESVLLKRNSDGRTVLEAMIEDQPTIKLTGGGVNPRTGKPSNPTYWYDASEYGLPKGTVFKVAIDTRRNKIPSAYPEGDTLPARDRFIESGINPGNEIINLNTEAGRRRYRELVNRETHGPAFESDVVVAAASTESEAFIVGFSVVFQ